MYCANDPINRIDPSGEIYIGGITGALILANVILWIPILITGVVKRGHEYIIGTSLSPSQKLFFEQAINFLEQHEESQYATLGRKLLSEGRIRVNPQLIREKARTEVFITYIHPEYLNPDTQRVMVHQ